MKFSMFEKLVVIGIAVTFTQLIFGYPAHAIYGMMLLILIMLRGILEYQRLK